MEHSLFLTFSAEDYSTGEQVHDANGNDATCAKRNTSGHLFRLMLGTEQEIEKLHAFA